MAEWILTDKDIGMDGAYYDYPELIRCKECVWWDRIDDSPIGYCHACKHRYYSNKWEISIRRTYKEDFYCADGERKTDNEQSQNSDC